MERKPKVWEGTVDPVDTPCPEEWVNKGKCSDGLPVWRGRRPAPPKRVKVSLAEFHAEEPSPEWVRYCQERDRVFQVNTPGFQD